ncbi:hypothetical protein FRC06_011214 [Ceratobasidium sp. 370]|nr:hypothetical protein FRC06_011214 [Ceratobasidium sp. 370]
MSCAVRGHEPDDCLNWERSPEPTFDLGGIVDTIPMLTAFVNTPPEPTTTLLGTEHNHTLYDTPLPNTGDVTEPEHVTDVDGMSSQHSAPRDSSCKRTLTEQGAEFFGGIKNLQYNPTTIVKDNTRKIKDWFNHLKSSLTSVTDGCQSI